MQIPDTPSSEQARLEALQYTQLLDTEPEPRFDRITKLVQQCLGVDIVLVSLVDAQRQFLKSRQGLDVCETHRDISFCGHTILRQGIFEVFDAQHDPRFYDNPLVTAAPHIRFYAGAPLIIKQEAIGTLCLIDAKPRQLNSSERLMLQEFAKLVEQEIIDRLQEQAHQKLIASELMYRSVLEGTRIGTWQWNVQTGETVFNARWAEMVGYTLDELAPISIDTWIKLAHPDDLAESNNLLQQHFAGELPFYDFKCRMQHKAGHWIWVHDRGRVISRTASGEPLMMYGTHADITAQKLAEGELKASRDQFQALVSNIPGITYRCKNDEKWTMLYMSSSIDPVSGYPASDFINNTVRTYASVIHPDDHQWLNEAVAEAIPAKKSWKLQYRILHKNGGIRWVEERGKAEYDASGNAIFLDGFILDITEEKQAKHQLVVLASQLPGVVYQFQQWPDGRAALPFASNALEKIYGLTPQQVKADASLLFEKAHPDDLAGIIKSIDESRNHLTEWHHEYRIVRENNTTTWLAGSAMPEDMPDGSTLWHGYIQDITTTKHYYLELERVNQELKLTQQRLDSASRNASIGFWQASLKTGELWWSPMIYQLFGFVEEETVPSVALFKSTVHPDDREIVEQSEKNAQENGVHDVIHRIIRPDGSIRWVHELAKMLPTDDNPEQILVGSVQDVTERMLLQQMKDEFVSTVSHELRTPLTAISGALSILQSGTLGKLPDKMYKVLHIAYQNSERLTHLINDLLDIEKLSAGKMPLELALLNADTEIHHAVENLLPFANQHQVTIKIKPPAKPLMLVADSLRLQQVLANLISNAIKFSNTDGVVTIHWFQIKQMVQIDVEDHGIGIVPEFQERVFERFAQADGSNRRRRGGTGLGLAICKELVEQMQGTISFSSEPEHGTTFSFQLPSELATMASQAVQE